MTQVMESVENSLGAPTPEEAAAMEEAEKLEKEQEEKERQAKGKNKPNVEYSEKLPRFDDLSRNIMGI